MARNVKVDELSKAVSSAALQVGYKQLKHEQNKAVNEFFSSRDVIVSLPTGSRESSVADLGGANAPPFGR